ncbi:MAG TPA: histidinol-phosphate transaminase [Patescibacteria group bacterium]|nr:histidinol-phosphate transaminase [Patescibacteria group bacterium]
MEISDKFKQFIENNQKMYWVQEGINVETDLSLSENPLGCSSKVKDILSKPDIISHYPDPTNSELKAKLAEQFLLEKGNIAVGNGIGPILDAIFRVILNDGDNVVIPQLTFPLIEQLVRLNSGNPKFVPMKLNFETDLKTIERKLDSKTKAICICNPNNPTGEVIPSQKLINLAKRITPVLLIIDEANIDFGGESVINRIKTQKNIVILRTFSKGFGLAGLRIAFMAGPEKLSGMVEEILISSEMNSISQLAAVTALSDKEFLLATSNFVKREREFLVNELTLRGLEVVPGKVLNILVKVDNFFPSSSMLCEILETKGVRTVNGNCFQGLGERFVRISPRTRKTNLQFLKTLDELLERSSI